ncbi:MAG: transketolase family protein [Erysipelothrix sp.]|nr:transketolase family protein [Erysipelothrix sp.]
MAKMATREAYGKALAKLIVEDDKVFVLDADLSKSTKTADAKAANESRHFNMGIAECNMMGVAAGIATGGNTVFASSFAMFAAGRAFEIVRNSICYPKLNVKICATHAGITLGEDGASHQAIEDLALMRSIPNMTVIQPCDDIETKQATQAIAKYKGPVYVRLGRSAVETVNTEDYVFEIGKGVVLRKGQNVAVVATGILVQEALKAADILKEEGILVTVVNIHTIKPIDKELLIELAKTHDVLLTCEEHNVMGGMGSAVAEFVSQHHPIKISMLGIEDTFGESGTPAALMEKCGITYKHVLDRIRKLLAQ